MKINQSILLDFTNNCIKKKKKMLEQEWFITAFTIPLFRQFIILEQWKAQNMWRWYTVEQDKNTDRNDSRVF